MNLVTLPVVGIHPRVKSLQPSYTGIPVILQGYLDLKKQHPPRNLQKDYAQGPMVALGGGAVSYERGTPVHGVESPDPSRVVTSPGAPLAPEGTT